MEEISKKDEQLPNSYQLINIETVDDYIFIETNVTSFLIDKDKNAYDVGKFGHAEHVFNMGDDIFAVLDEKYKQNLVNIKTKEVYISQRNCYSGIYRINDDFVYTAGSDYGKNVFNIRTKKFIKPEVDIPVEYSMAIAPNLFMYENNDYHNQIYQHFVINQDGKLVYNCGAYFPYYTEGTLVLSLLKDNEVVLVRNVCTEFPEVETIRQNKIVNSNPLIHENEEHKADAVCFVSGTYFTITDFNMNVIKKYPLNIDYDDVEIQLWGDVAVIIVGKEEKFYCIALNIKTGKQIKHHGIWVLPLDVKGPTVIRGCDPLENQQYMFTLYDEDGNEYTHHQAKDCFNIHNANMNLYKYTRVDGTDQNIVYDIFTRKEKKIPWYDVKFRIDSKFNYMPFGCGLRYDETHQYLIIDIVDEELNVVYEGLTSNEYRINGEDFRYEFKNNLLFLTIPMYNGPRTYYKKVVLDKNGNKLYDSFNGSLSFIGNFLQVIDEENNRTYYIDSRTGEIHNNIEFTLNEFALPDTLNVDGKVVKLLKRKDISGE